MTKDEALKLALEALENISTALREDDVLGSDSELMLNAITAIKEALAQPEQGALKELRQMLQIEVDRLIAANAPATEVIDYKAAEFCEKQFLKPSMFLQFVEPEERTWVGLTDEERLRVLQFIDPKAVRFPLGFKQIAESIERLLKEKNT